MAQMLRTLRSAMERLLEATVIALMVSLAVVVVLAVIFRKAGASLVWYDEIASVMLAWLTYYAAALAALKRAHLGFSGLVDVLPRAPRLLALLIAESCVFAFFILLAWMGYEVLVVLKGDTLVSLPWVPTRLTQSVIPIGAVLFVLAEALSLPDALREAKGAPLADHSTEAADG